MPTLYTPSRAAALLGVSSAALRKYADLYAKHLSTEATAKPRAFTVADLRLFAFVAHATAMGRTHKAIQESISTQGEDFAAFTWDAPEDAEDAQEAPSTALVPVAQLQAAHALLQDAQRREAEARAEAEAARERIAALERELGRAEGELAARRRSLWAKLFGG